VVTGVTAGRGRGARHPAWQVKCKKWAPLLACISAFSVHLIFSKILFLAFLKNFTGDPVNCITNLPRFFMCLNMRFPEYAIILIKQISASLPPIAIQGIKNSVPSPPGAFVGLAPQKKFQPPN